MRVIKVAEHRKTVIGKIGLQLEYISGLVFLILFYATRTTSKITRAFFMTVGILQWQDQMYRFDLNLHCTNGPCDYAYGPIIIYR